MKMSYFQEEWSNRPDWIEAAQRTLSEVWTTTYRGGQAVDRAESQERLPGEEPVSHWEHKRRVRIAQIGDE